MELCILKSVCLITARLDYSFFFFFWDIFCLFVSLYQAIFPMTWMFLPSLFFLFQHLPLWIYTIEKFAFEDCDDLARGTFLIMKDLSWVKAVNFNYTFRASWNLTYLKHCAHTVNDRFISANMISLNPLVTWLCQGWKFDNFFYFKQTYIYPEPINHFVSWDKRSTELQVTLWSSMNWAEETEAPLPPLPNNKRLCAKSWQDFCDKIVSVL